MSRAAGVVAGIEAAGAVFELVDPAIAFRARLAEGGRLVPGETVATLSGPARGILTGERVALNFLGRLSGVATTTAAFVAAAGPGGRDLVFDTRKTTPGLRRAEKRAVLAGGGRNHRLGLFDAYLVKDNHLAALVQAGQARDRREAVSLLVRRALAGRSSPRIPVEVEVESEAEALAAAAAGADWVMLDNLGPDASARVARRLRAAGFRGGIEVSGGVTLETVGLFARAGVDRVSVGALTHSAPGLDFSLEADPAPVP